MHCWLAIDLVFIWTVHAERCKKRREKGEKEIGKHLVDRPTDRGLNKRERRRKKQKFAFLLCPFRFWLLVPYQKAPLERRLRDPAPGDVR